MKEISVTFRPFEESDLELRTKWLQNPAVADNLGWQNRRGTTLEEQKKWYENYKDNDNDHRFIILADDIPVGMVGITDISPVDHNGMLYVLIGEDDYRGNGIGRKACEFIIDFAFGKLKFHKLFLEVNSYNSKAIALYKSLGFTEEGRLTEKVFYKGKYYDEVYMGLKKRKLENNMTELR
jgi:RimJ/RimL family protein N-acetyltransferase